MTKAFDSGMVEGSLALDCMAWRANTVPKEFVELLEALPLPAYLCTAYGVVLHANAAALGVHRASPPPWLEPLCRFRRSTERRTVRALSVAGRRCVLVVDSGALDMERARRRRVDELTPPPRMAELTRLLVEGLSDSEIAVETGLTYRTVRTYVRRLFAKLGVHSRTELIRRVLER